MSISVECCINIDSKLEHFCVLYKFYINCCTTARIPLVCQNLSNKNFLTKPKTVNLILFSFSTCLHQLHNKKNVFLTFFLFVNWAGQMSAGQTGPKIGSPKFLDNPTNHLLQAVPTMVPPFWRKQNQTGS